MSHNFPETDDHMFIERERMILDADQHDEMLEAFIEDEQERQDGLVEEGNILSEEDAEKLIANYIRQDWSGSRMDQIPY